MSCPDDFFAEQFLPHHVQLLLEILLYFVAKLYQNMLTLSS